MERKKVFVAMSGGVDSSTSAFLLKSQSYDVVGVFMRCYNVDGCAERDSEDARRVAEKIGIPFYVWDFEEEYKKRVVDYMVRGYQQGVTPNPDVMCNKEIKFGLFLKRALAVGADYIATGHYVRSVEVQLPTSDKESPVANCRLFSARDKSKDQSYFLWTLTQDNLRQCLFPVGNYLKSEVREIARKAGLPTAEKKDSQGICFLGKVTLGEFLALYLPERRGAVLTAVGQKIGEHRGIQFYTVGQRHIGVSVNQPLYVVKKKVADNELVVVEANDSSALGEKEIELQSVNFTDPEYFSDSPKEGMPILVRVRYRQPLAEARLKKGNLAVRLIFAEPQKFVAPGQSAVFYSEESELLGGGIIQ